MRETMQCDIAIIGAGSGGLSVAAVAAQLGLSVVLIEESKMGGDCLNFGCVPSKALIAAARTARGFLTANQFGIESVEPKINFKKVMEHVVGVINSIAPNDSVERFTQLGARVIQATAKFIDEKTIIAGDIHIQARRFIIATGSSPATPPIPGLDKVAYLTNETIFQLREKPEHLVIIGGGPIGCELAQAFLMLGVKVTVLEAFTIMPRDDVDLVSQIRETLVSQGLNLQESVKILQVRQKDDSIEIHFEKNGVQSTVMGSHLLVAAGRKANVEHLDLTKAGIEFTAKGIPVDSRLRTSNKKVFAIGDVTGPYQFTHMANYQAGIVIKNIIFKLPVSVDYRVIPWVTYTTPELAHVGLIEKDALKTDPTAQIIFLNMTENDRAQAEHQTQGKIKLIVNRKGHILGVSILAENAGELILPWILMMQEKLTLKSMTDVIVPYPTLSEISKRAAGEFYKPLLFSSKVKRLVGFLKYF
jgi:pyruvate/2-oxoglutarate dehydrogenase complex dihydrolipoamide dehydrogenase (E3) component